MTELWSLTEWVEREIRGKEVVGSLFLPTSNRLPPLKGLMDLKSFTRLRNRIVDPPKASGASFDRRVLYQAKTLGLWYLELAVLWFAGFAGRHLNRTSPTGITGTAETVPWG